MKAAPVISDKPTIGLEAKRLRLSCRLNKMDLAERAGVSAAHIDLLERNYPVPLDSKRRIFQALWAIKAKRWCP